MLNITQSTKNPTDLGEGLGTELSAAVKGYRLLLLQNQTKANNRQKSKPIQHDYQPKQSLHNVKLCRCSDF